MENETKSEHGKAVDAMMQESTRRPPADEPPASDPMLQHFHYEHLPEHLRAVSQPFGILAKQIVENLPRNAERTVALRKLLEAKDCAVRCVLFKA